MAVMEIRISEEMLLNLKGRGMGGGGGQQNVSESLKVLHYHS